jgi:hypothetical protein
MGHAILRWRSVTEPSGSGPANAKGVAPLREGTRPALMRDRLNQWIFSDGADTHDHTLPSHSPTYGLAAPLAGKRQEERVRF